MGAGDRPLVGHPVSTRFHAGWLPPAPASSPDRFHVGHRPWPHSGLVRIPEQASIRASPLRLAAPLASKQQMHRATSAPSATFCAAPESMETAGLRFRAADHIATLRRRRIAALAQSADRPLGDSCSGVHESHSCLAVYRRADIIESSALANSGGIMRLGERPVMHTDRARNSEGQVRSSRHKRDELHSYAGCASLGAAAVTATRSLPAGAHGHFSLAGHRVWTSNSAIAHDLLWGSVQVARVS